MQVVVALISGLFAGLMHAWSGPDHLAAVAPLAAQGSRRKAKSVQYSGLTPSWVIGVRWGLGHSSGVLLIGFLAIFFREALPLDSVSSIAERLVGVVLIGLGIWGLRKAFIQRVHSHPHTHGEDSHTHYHVHGPGTRRSSPVRPDEERAHTHTHAAFAIGTLHGVAGSSHFIGVLPALAFPSPFATVSYLVGYGAGTVLGMAGFSSVIGALRNWRGLAGAAGYRRLMCASSCAALVVGVYWIW